MPRIKLSQILPCASFFAAGRVIAGLAALFMQLTLVLWPMATRWARQSNERTGVEKLLAELSEAHRAPSMSDPYATPVKKFRQLA